MSNKVKLILTLGIFVLLLGGSLGLKSFLDSQYQNEESFEGNTAGNLNNKGLYCQLGEKVYFANGYDGGKLYVMNADESNIKKLSNNKVEYINADSTCLYYYLNDNAASTGIGFTMQLNGLYSYKLKSQKTDCLDKTPCGIVKLLGNTLYYQRHDEKAAKTTLYRMDIHKKIPDPFLEIDANPACVYGGRLFYNGMEEDHHLYQLDANSGQGALIADVDAWNSVIYDGDVYFMDVSDNYKLCRYSFLDEKKETLTEDRVDCFNVANGKIYYQKNSKEEPALKVMNLDGSDPQMIAEGNFTALNATSKYLYFQSFGAKEPVYKVSLENGSNQVMTFDGAKEAMKKENK